MKKEMLYKPNQLIAMKYSQKITTIQKKVYNVFLKNAQNIIKFKQNDVEIKDDIDALYSFEIKCDELYKIANIKKNDYKYIDEEIENLMQIIVTFRDKDNINDWEKMSILPSVKRIGNKYVYSIFGKIAKALKEQTFFTPLNLMYIRTLTSQYSIIFYELAIRYKNYKIPKMSIEELREITNTKKQYTRFFDFKKRVLDVACNEITEKTDINLSYTTEKEGRRVAYIDFVITKKTIKPLENSAEISKNKANLKKAMIPLDDETPEETAAITKYLVDHSNLHIKNPGAYRKKLLRVLREKGYLNINEFEERLQQEKEEVAKKQEELLKEAGISLKGLFKKI